MKRAFCGLWLIERGMLHLERASCGFMAYRTRNVTFEARLLWFRLIERGMLHLKRACFSMWLIERGMLHLKRACFSMWLIEQGMLHLKRACCGLGL